MWKKYLQVDNIGLLPEGRGWLLVEFGGALHLAQVIQMAMREGRSGPARAYPEARYLTQAARPSLPRLPMAFGMSAVLLLIGTVVMRIVRRRKTR
jgi:hypothetical protein